MKVLISGFGPFDIFESNPSEIILPSLKAKSCSKVSIETIVLPVSFKNSFEQWRLAFESCRPDVSILLGLAGRREVISLEKVAINYRDSERADNEGVVYTGEPVIATGPDAYFSSLPLKKILSSLGENEDFFELSLSAGSYICNDLFYQVMHFLSSQGDKHPAGFIHIPKFESITEVQQIELLYQVIFSIYSNDDSSSNYKSKLQTD